MRQLIYGVLLAFAFTAVPVGSAMAEAPAKVAKKRAVKKGKKRVTKKRVVKTRTKKKRVRKAKSRRAKRVKKPAASE